MLAIFLLATPPSSIGAAAIAVVVSYFAAVWFLTARRSTEAAVYAAASLLLAASCYEQILFTISISQILVFLNVLFASIMLSSDAQWKAEDQGFAFRTYLRSLSPLKFFGFGTFSLFFVMSCTVLLGKEIPVFLTDALYVMMTALVAVVLYSTLRDKT